MIEEEFAQKAAKAFEELELEEGREGEQINELVTRLQTAAYAKGIRESMSVPSESERDGDPTFPEYEANFGNHSAVCFDCGCTLDLAFISIHERFHISLNNSTQSYVTGYQENE